MNQSQRFSVRECFVDSSAYFALTDTDDDNHETAQRVVHALSRLRVKQVTTNYVIAETHALLVNGLDAATARTFIRELQASNTAVLHVPLLDEARAWHITHCARSRRSV